MAAAMAMSRAGGRASCPVAARTAAATRAEKRQPRKLTGMACATRPARSATVKPAKPKALPSAARLPASAPPDSPSRTMTNMPIPPSAMAAQVAGRTASARIRRPRRAARKGEAEKRKTALATVVDWMA